MILRDKVNLVHLLCDFIYSFLTREQNRGSQNTLGDFAPNASV